jgi:HTH-type transcriptional regulator / antitoxin HigA
MIRPIKTEQDYDAALREIEKLWDAPPASAAADRLDVLATLVAAYEEKHHRIDPPDVIEAIKFRLEQGKLRRADLAKLFGRSRTSEILNRKRNLSLGQIRKLYSLGIPADVLIAEPKVRRRRNTG